MTDDTSTAHPEQRAEPYDVDWPVCYRDPHDGRAYPPGTWHWSPRI
jgi:hypothetical protein